jgi:hypothetical protein
MRAAFSSPRLPPTPPRPPGFNLLLKYMNPLVISLACNMEPVLGSLLGWAVGLPVRPSLGTLAGGALIMLCTVFVTVSSHRREQEEAHRAAAAAKIRRIMDDSEDLDDDWF